MTAPVRVDVEVLPHGEGLELPNFQTAGAAGADIRAAVSGPLQLQPGQSILVPTGLKVAIPPGFEIQVRPRSGLAMREQITILNAPGTIDADYRGEVMILLINLGTRPFFVERGLRIAQLVLNRIDRIEWNVVESVGETDRSPDGFGSTGL